MANKGLLKDIHSDNRDQNRIIITKCLFPECSGYYTDSISETTRIQCKDPKHRHSVEKSKSEIFPREKNKKAGSSSTGEPTERMASSVRQQSFRSDTPA
jgi:hypothetical protein